MTGLSLGVCMANREFDCILCGRHFSRMTADAIFFVEQICDECLEELWQLNEAARREHVSQQLTKRGIQDEGFKNGLLEAISRMAEQRQRLDTLTKPLEERKHQE